MSESKRRSRRKGRLSSDSSRRPRPMGRAENPLIRLSGGFPDRIRVSLRYVTKFVVTTSVGTSQYAWRGNGVYDPDVTSTGAQPTNFDDFTKVYAMWRVHGSRARVSLNGTSAAQSGIVSFGARQSTTASTVSDDAARPRHEVAWISSSSTGFGAKNQFDMRYSTQSILGLTPAQYQGSTGLDGTGAADPAIPWYWVLNHESNDGSTATTTYGLMMIDYDVEFFKRVDQELDLLSARAPSSSVREETKTHAPEGAAAKAEASKLVTPPAALTRATPTFVGAGGLSSLSSRGYVVV